MDRARAAAHPSARLRVVRVALERAPSRMLARRRGCVAVALARALTSRARVVGASTADAAASRWRRGELSRAREAPARTARTRTEDDAARVSRARRRAIEWAVRKSEFAARRDAAASAGGWTRAREARASGRAVPVVDASFVERCARVALVGAPNAGKSALANALVGDKVSAVSRKTNTTRRRAIGCRTVGEAQVVVVDAPGVVGREHYRNAAHERKVEGAFETAGECDALALVVDAERQLERKDSRVLEIVRRVREAMDDARESRGIDLKPVLVLNKVDAVPKERRPSLVKMVDYFQNAGGEGFAFARVFPVSALTGAGTKALLDYLLEIAPEAPWEFDPMKTTDMTDAQRALEIVRECVYNRLNAELPYGIDIAHVSWEDFKNGDVRIEQNVLVETASQRKIVVGKAGEVIGQIGINGRVMLEEIFGRNVHLILNVKLKRKKKNYRMSEDVVYAENY